MNILAIRGLHWFAHKQSFSLTLKRAAFNAKHRAGQWGKGESKIVGDLVMKYADGGHAQVLGSGAGDICGVLDMGSLIAVNCVDMSDAACKNASIRYGHMPNAIFVCGDMVTCAKTNVAVTLFPESLYYLDGSTQLELLSRLSGIIIVTLADPEKHAEIVSMINSRFQVLESLTVGPSAILVFQQKTK